MSAADLVQLGNQLRSSPDLDSVVRTIATAASRTLGFDEIAVYLLEPDGASYRAHAVVGRDEAVDRAILATPIPAAVLDAMLVERYQIGAAYFVDHRDHAWTPEERRYFPVAQAGPAVGGEWHRDDLLLVPLKATSDRIVGVLDLADPTDRRLPDVALSRQLEVFATFAVTAVVNAQQYEELERARAALEEQLQVRHDLLDLSGVLLGTLDSAAVFGEIADVLKRLVDYDTIDISLVDESEDELVTIFAQDQWAEEILEFRMPVDHGVGGWVVRNDEAQLINDMNSDSRAVRVPGTDLEQQASILVPLRHTGRVIGLLIIDRLGGRTFEVRDLETVQLFANLAAIAIQNARTYKEMELQASTDGLTGLDNHRRFQETLASEVARAARYESGFCLLMMDLDHFKVINDSLGHQHGDGVLQAVAGVLRRCSRESDSAARYGGEEFTMILPHASLDEARGAAERIRALVAEIPAGDPVLKVTMSIGVAAFPDAAGDKDGIIGAADAALLAAKAAGRDRVCTYGEPAAAVRRAPAETALTQFARRFAARAGLSDEEATALASAAEVLESAPQGDGLRAINGKKAGEAAEAASPIILQVFNALLYGTERWDGHGYPEGLRGEAIPPVARAYAVLRAWVESGAAGGASLRARSGKQLDPRLVNRFLAFLAEETGRLSPVSALPRAGARER